MRKKRSASGYWRLICRYCVRTGLCIGCSFRKSSNNTVSYLYRPSLLGELAGFSMAIVSLTLTPSLQLQHQYIKSDARNIAYLCRVRCWMLTYASLLLFGVDLLF